MCSSDLKGPAGTRVRLTVQRPGSGRRTLTLVRREIRVPLVEAKLERPGGVLVGVVELAAFSDGAHGQVARAVRRLAARGARAWVLDLRGNTGGLAAMLMGVAGHFLDSRVSLGTMRTRESVLQFVANPRRAAADGSRVEPYGGPLAILVDALTGSASECFAGGMQAIGRARIFGERSMGQALPALFDRLPNGDVLIHAYGDFTTPKGTRLEGEGVVPDEVVPSGRAELIAGRDAVLEAALRWVDRCGGTRRHANCE